MELPFLTARFLFEGKLIDDAAGLFYLKRLEAAKMTSLWKIKSTTLLLKQKMKCTNRSKSNVLSS